MKPWANRLRASSHALGGPLSNPASPETPEGNTNLSWVTAKAGVENCRHFPCKITITTIINLSTMEGGLSMYKALHKLYCTAQYTETSSDSHESGIEGAQRVKQLA